MVDHEAKEHQVLLIAQDLARRFPTMEPEVVESTVREVYERLEADARVDTFLSVLVRRRSVEALSARGGGGPTARPLPER